MLKYLKKTFDYIQVSKSKNTLKVSNVVENKKNCRIYFQISYVYVVVCTYIVYRLIP
jgi:hypothetical protein